MREYAPGATVVYDTVDLHWLREARKAALAAAASDAVGTSNGSVDLERLGPRSRALRELELAMIRAADVTLVVSESERAQVQQDVPAATTMLIPTMHEVDPNVLPPEDRAGIIFVGGFAHPPNVDAAIRLVRDIMPTVWRELGDVTVTIRRPRYARSLRRWWMSPAGSRICSPR